jgi:Family of unknown function (DUF6056)
MPPGNCMSRRALFNAFLVLLAASLLKYAWLALYCHPMADDWSYAHQGITRELFPWLKGEYLNWNGRYFSNVLVGRGPLVLGLDALWLYRSVPVALLLLTGVAAFALMRSMTRHVLNAREQVAGALVFLSLFVQGMPDAGEGFYWYTGAVTYQLGSVLFLFHLARLVRDRSSGGTGFFRSVVDALLIIAIIGSSEVHMVLMVALHGAIMLLRRTPSASPTLRWWKFLLVLACAGVVVFAPGNAVRSALFADTHDALHSAWWGFLQTGRFALTWATDPALLVCSVLYLPLSRRLATTDDRFAHAFGLKPWMTSTALLAVIFLCAFPAYWGTGILGQHRTMNVAYCFFLPLWLLNLTSWDVHVFSKRWNVLSRLSPTVVGLLGIALIVLLNLDRNGGDAARDLVTGRAARFDAQLEHRYFLLEQAHTNGLPVMLPMITDPPESLPLYELRDDPHHWVNQCYALYFGIEGRPVHRGPAPDP